MNHRSSTLPLLLALMLASCFASASWSTAGCVPENKVQKILDEVEALRDDCGNSVDCWKKQRQRITDALEAQPHNVFLHREYQDIIERHTPADRKTDEIKALKERYTKLARKRPNDALYQYLRGRVHLNTSDQAQAAFERSLELDPDLPWAHIGLTYLSAFVSENKDPETAKHHLSRFSELCPDEVDMLITYARLVDDKEFWRQKLETISARFQASDLSDHVANLPAFWTLRFRVAAPTDHAQIRQEVAADLERLESLGLHDDKSWWRALKEGYEMTSNEKELARVEAKLVELDPCSVMTIMTTFNKFSEEHPKPEADATPDQVAEHDALADTMSLEWLERCPKNSFVAMQRFSTVQARESVTLQDIITAGEHYMATWEKDTNRFSDPFSRIASAYVEHDHFEPVPAMIEKAREESAKRFEEQMAMPSLPAEMRKMMESGRLYETWNHDMLQAKALLGLDRYDELHTQLLDLEAKLEERKPGDDEQDDQKAGMYRGMAQGYWAMQAKLADQQERKLDAVVYFRNAHSFAAKDTEEYLERATELWRELGGGDAAWQAYAPAGEGLEDLDISAWTEKGEALANFELPDMVGKTWKVGDFQGKKVFANIWATWCGPCRKELPFVQDLYEQMKDDQDTLILTLNIDQNPGVVAPYMEKNSFDFPVLFAESYVNDALSGAVSIPRNWIVDSEGTLLKEQTGFNPELTSEEWIGEILAELIAKNAE